uniref:type II toxin-antitoxin system VapB family antitoxin n=1 Tax=uncultured Williamsia sp. TaxID=259311 RepID=UPI002638559E|nr:type II toxin-antitoxin system VapB family antitoxin [uncultured Williamsia sp.]
MIFKGVRNGKPYRDHGLTTRDWAKIPPRQFRLDQLTTVTTALALDKLLSEDSTFYGDLFAHVVRWHGEMYLEDGLHRAVRSALRNRHIIHARLLDLDALHPEAPEPGGDTEDTAPITPRPAAPAPPRPRADVHGWTEPPDRRATR